MPYKNFEEYNMQVTDDVKNRYKNIIEDLGEDIGRDGLLKTPERAAKAMQFLTQGYHQDPVEILKSAMFKESYNEMVLVKDIELYSLCEHHILPFFGKAHIAYIPRANVVGLSKLSRLLEVYARRMQIQERLTNQIADGMMKVMNPLGCGVIIEAKHFCMVCRGVQKKNSTMITSAIRGLFKSAEVKNEFHRLCK